MSDVHYTPGWVTQLAVDSGLFGRPRDGEVWLEPSAGTGAILRVLRPAFPRVQLHAVEIEDRRAELAEVAHAVTIGNFLGMDPYEVSLVVGNPPFSKALEFVHHGLRFAPRVLFLLRLAFLESQERADWFANAAPDVAVIPDRISFYAGSDKTAYAWFTFHRTPRTTGTLRVLPAVPQALREKGGARLPQPTLFEGV